MRIILVITLLVCSVITCHAQNKFTILYNTTMPAYDSSRADRQSLPVCLVINDSLSFTYYPDIPVWPDKIDLPLGSNYWPKSTFIDTANNKLIWPAGPSNKPKQLLLVVDSCSRGVWDIYEMKKEILGYTCTMARGVMNGRKIQAWFTTELPPSFAPFFCTRLPGTVLEYWNEGFGYVFTAIQVKKEAAAIVEPNYCRKVPKSHYQDIQKKRKM